MSEETLKDVNARCGKILRMLHERAKLAAERGNIHDASAMDKVIADFSAISTELETVCTKTQLSSSAQSGSKNHYYDTKKKVARPADSSGLS